jgi:hypothetical protein
MRVLVANIPLPANRFLADLDAQLSEMCDLTHSSDAFWNMEGDFDVVHLHFPEYLTYEIEKAYSNELPDELIDQVAERLRFWAARARIVVTRHVLLPHDALKDHQWEKMYEVVYSHADGIVHFAQPSVDEFRERYARTCFVRGRMPEQVIIPHQNYESLPSGMTRAEARKALGIRPDAQVLLVFGAIRSNAERNLILNTFRGIGASGKVLLVSRWRENLADVAWIRLKYWIRDAKRLYYRMRPGYYFNYGFVREEDAQVYVEACDVFFIPRLRVLNSGNIALGMTFGRVIVGPDSWDVGAILEATSNPVFDPDLPKTAIAAVEKGFALAREGRVGAANQRIAMTDWKPVVCAAQYFRFFTQLIGSELSLETT